MGALVFFKQQQAPSLEGDLSAEPPTLRPYEDIFIFLYKKFLYKIYRYFYNLSPCKISYGLPVITIKSEVPTI
jgi:hypothetical protein